jgi:hypothetical protein
MLGHLYDRSDLPWSVANSEFFNRLYYGWVPRTDPDVVARCKRCSNFLSKSVQECNVLGRKSIIPCSVDEYSQHK